MQRAETTRLDNVEDLADTELVRLAQQGDAPAFRAIMRRHNRRLYRVARGILRDDSEAEDAVQETYVRGFTALGEFRGEANLSTWLTRIVMNEALGRVRRRRPTIELTALDAPEERNRARVIPFPLMNAADNDPERSAARHQIRRLLEKAIDELPEPFRLVFVMRVIEEMSIEETALNLGLRPETVKTRLHRARRLLRQAVDHQLAAALTDTFPFAGARCEELANTVLARLGIPSPDSEDDPAA